MPPAQPDGSDSETQASTWVRDRLKPATLGSIPAGSAILMIQVKVAAQDTAALMNPFHVGGAPTGLPNGTALLLNRERVDGDASASQAADTQETLKAGSGLSFKPKFEMYVFAAPAGRWRISGIGMSPVLNFCLGAPSFEVKPGEVVYAGSFDLGSGDLGPDLDLAPARAWLAGHPQADALRPAVYINGSRGPCSGSAIYALQVKGAPFEPGYGWGSQAAHP